MKFNERQIGQISVEVRDAFVQQWLFLLVRRLCSSINNFFMFLFGVFHGLKRSGERMESLNV